MLGKSALGAGIGVVLLLTYGRGFCLVAGIYNVFVASEIRKDLQMVVSGKVQSGGFIYVESCNARLCTDSM